MAERTDVQALTDLCDLFDTHGIVRLTEGDARRLRSVLAALAAEKARADRLAAALLWLRNLASGVGKAGEEPEPGEYEAACDAAVSERERAQPEPDEEREPDTLRNLGVEWRP